MGESLSNFEKTKKLGLIVGGSAATVGVGRLCGLARCNKSEKGYGVSERSSCNGRGA